MPKSPRALGLCLVVAGFASCSGRVELPDGGSAGPNQTGLGGRSANGDVGGKLGAAGQLGAAGKLGAGATPGAAGAGAGSSVGGSPDGGAGDAAGSGAGTIEAEAPLVPIPGNSVTGRVHFTERGDSVDMTITLAGCPAGPHALHLHANAACGDDGNAAGGHWSPQGEGIADIECGANGKAKFSLQIARGVWSIGDPAVSDLLRHAIILHAGSGQPDPGARIACGIPAKLP